MHKFTMKDAKYPHHEVATDIEIQQSHSYEIKEEPSYMPDYHRSKHHQQHHTEQTYEDPVPVIVLRIPGPQKYAVHLQALLQQYLEMRAAMYIHALAEEERRGSLQHPQHYIQQQNQAMQYYHQMLQSAHTAPQQMMYHHYQPSAPPQQHSHHNHHQSVQPQSPHMMYYHQTHHNQQPQQYPQQYIEVEHVADGYHQIPAGEQSYYHHSTAPAVVEVTPGPSYLPPTGHQSQQEHPTSYINFVTPVYEQSELQHHQQQHAVNEDHDDDHIAENYPSEKHTQVIYKKKNQQRIKPGIVYHEPEIQKRPIVVAEPQEEQYNHKDDYHHHHHHHQYQQQQISVPLHRTKPPFNYHVAVSTLAPNHEELHERHHPKRMIGLTREQFEKARRIVMKSKRSRGSMKPERPMMMSH